MIWRLSATSNPTAAIGISTKYGCVLSFVSGLLFMCTPPSQKTRRRLCVERVASREVINSGGGKRRAGTVWRNSDFMQNATDIFDQDIDARVRRERLCGSH